MPAHDRRTEAGVPLFLANIALAGFLKWQPWPPPAIGIAAVLAAAVAYLAASHARWTRHLLGRTAPRPQARAARLQSALWACSSPEPEATCSVAVAAAWPLLWQAA